MRTKGWRKVFSFTFVQYVKTKSFIVSSIIISVIIAVICVLTNILPVIMNSDNSSDDSNEPETTVNEFYKSGEVYLFDEVKILADDDKDMLSEVFKERFTEPQSSFDDVIDELKATEAMKIAVKITSRTDKDGKLTGYEVRSYYAPNAKGSADDLNVIISGLVERRILLNAGVAPEKYEDTQVSVTTLKTEAGSKNLNPIQGLVNYALPIAVSFVLFMFIYTYGTIVAQAIATEKTSRVMELLLTSVRPLAVVIGKVLAMGLVSFLQFFLMIGIGAASFALSSPFGWMSKAMELLKNPDIQAALSQVGQSGGAVGSVAGVSSSEFEIAQTMNEFTKVFTPMNIVLIILIFILGFLFFSLIAALIGASISRTEDLQAAMSPYSIIGVLGMYLAYFPVIFNADALSSGDSVTNPVQLFSYYCPISSPFALPGAVMLGTLSPAKTAIAVLVLAAFVVLIAVIVSKVYEAIILHNGNRIKLGDLLKMAVRR